MSKVTTQSDDTIDLKELFFSLIAQWKIILLCIVLSFICAVIYLRTTAEIYSVDALIQVEDKKGGANAALLGSELSSVINASGLGNQPAQAEIEILRSRLVIGTTIRDLNLDIQIKPTDDSFWNKLTHSILFDTNYSKNGISVIENGEHFEIRQFDIPSAYLDQTLILQFSTHNRYTLIDKHSQQVVYQGELNKMAQAGAWKVSIFAKKAPQRSFVIIKNGLPTAMKRFLLDYAIAERGKQTGIVGLSYQGVDKQHIAHVLNYILTIYKAQNIKQNSAEKEQTLQFLQQKLPELKADLDSSERAFNKFREKYNTVDVSKESELYLKQSIELETQKIQLEQKQAELSTQYTNEHPVMIEINAQITAISKKIDELNNTIKQVPEVQRQYLQYYRDVQVKSELYTNLLNTYQTMTIAKAGEIGNVRIVDHAIEPIEPIKPKKMIILALSLLLGGFLGTLIALLRNLVRSGIRDTEVIEAELELPVYGTIPQSSYQPKNIKKRQSLPILAVTHSDDMTVESLRSVRTTLLFALAQAKNNIIMITSPAPEAGKSFVSVNLAALLAQMNKRTLVIDLDLRRGYLHKYFKHNNQKGLSDVLLKDIALEDVTISTEQEHLSFIARGEHPSNTAELLNSTKFIQLLETLQQQYDYIVLDTPPVLAVADSLIIAKYSAMNLVIARYGKTPLKELELVKKRFDHIDERINGVILNGIEVKGNLNYGYSYNYNYSNKASK